MRIKPRINDVKGNLIISPNPATQYRYIKNASGLLFIVQDLMCKVLLSKLVSSEDFELDISSFVPGVYLIKFDNGNFSKIIKCNLSEKNT